MKTNIRDIDWYEEEERGTADRPAGKYQDVPEGGCQVEKAQWALVRMQFNRRKLMRAYSTELISEVIRCTSVELWSEESWLSVRNINKWR